MAQDIILISGAIASGKTSLCDMLASRYGFQVLKTRHLIQANVGASAERESLQQAGEHLDQDTSGRWVAAALARQVQKLPGAAVILVDAVRTQSQVMAIREAFGPRVVHIHLTAPLDALAKRYTARRGEVQELKSYVGVRVNKTEAHVEELAPVADVVIDTHLNNIQDVVVQVASLLRPHADGK